MNKFYLLLLCCIVLLRATSQSGSLDPTFGNKGVQITSFFGNLDLLSESGSVVLTSVNGNIFLVILVGNSTTTLTRIARYLPDGRLDSSYGKAGYSNDVDMSSSCAIMQGGKIIVAGYTGKFGSSDFALARYMADGTLDSSFGKNGLATTDFNGLEDIATSITLQGDNILLTGYISYGGGYDDFALARYTADGRLDSTFGGNGKVITRFQKNSRSYARSIMLQGDKIIVAGSTYNYRSEDQDFALIRYMADGTPDSTFGKNGKVTTDFDSTWDEATSIVLQGEKIVVGGFSGEYGIHYDFALTRYTTDGTLDSSFGVHGKLTTGFDNKQDNKMTSIKLQGDKMIVAGSSGKYVYYGSTIDFALARYTTDGTLDSSFGEGGRVITDFNNSDDYLSSIAFLNDKIIAAGSSKGDFAVARYSANGVLDTGFAEQGLLTGYFPASRIYFASTVMQGNKVLAAGTTLDNDHNLGFAVARYTLMGNLDSSFGKDGAVTTNFTNFNSTASSIALQGDKIIVVGSAWDQAREVQDFALARYTADGRLDSTFGINGKVTTEFDYYDVFASSSVLQGDKIVVAGFYYEGDMALARYKADGTLDSTFGVNGKVRTDFDTPFEHASAIVLQGDKIVVAGFTNIYNHYADFTLTRYTADGTLDSSFGMNGRVTTDFDSSNDYATSMTLQGDKIIVGGYTELSDYTNDFALARYMADGTLDSSFGVNGKITTDFNNTSDYANSITLQDGKIIAAGYSSLKDTSDFALARYTADGRLDSTFGTRGIVTTDLGGSSSIQDLALLQNRLYAVGSVSRFDGTFGAVAAYQLEAPEPTISIADVTVSEDKRFAVATVRLSAPTNKLVQVHFTTRDKTASSKKDYTPVSGPLLFIPGVNTTAKIVIPIIDDNQQESNEQLEVVLSNARNATIQESIAVVTIVDNDDALIAKQESTSLHIKVSPNPAADAFTVQLKGSNLKQPVSIRVYDLSGKLLEERNNVNVGQSLRLGDRYTAGTYFIEAIQGNIKAQTKAIMSGK